MFFLVTDVYSKALFVRPLPNIGAYATMNAMKNGLLVKMVSDNEKHFISQEFKEFASRWCL